MVASKKPNPAAKQTAKKSQRRSRRRRRPRRRRRRRRRRPRSERRRRPAHRHGRLQPKPPAATKARAAKQDHRQEQPAAKTPAAKAPAAKTTTAKRRQPRRRHRPRRRRPRSRRRRACRRRRRRPKPVDGQAGDAAPRAEAAVARHSVAAVELSPRPPRDPRAARHSKDGIAYTKDFDVKFLKAQRDELIARRAVRARPGDAPRGRGDEPHRRRRDGRRAVRRRRRRGRHDGRPARPRPGAVDAGPPDDRRHRCRARADHARHVRLLRGVRPADSRANGSRRCRRPRCSPPRRSAASACAELAETVPTMTIARPWRAPILIALVVVLLDQLTKHWAVNALVGRTRHRRHLDAAVQPRVQQRDGLQPRASGFGPYIAVVATLVIVWLLVVVAQRRDEARRVRYGLPDRRRCRQPDRPDVPRRRLAAGLGRRLHRLPVVPDLQRRRHRRERRCRRVDPQQHPRRVRARRARCRTTIDPNADRSRADPAGSRDDR